MNSLILAKNSKNQNSQNSSKISKIKNDKKKPVKKLGKNQSLEENKSAKNTHISKNNLQTNLEDSLKIIPKLGQNQDKMPQIIILYGPPAAGKGTQADFLKQNLPDYFHLDFGTALRFFVANELGNYFEPKINKKIAIEIKKLEIQKILKNLKREDLESEKIKFSKLTEKSPKNGIDDKIRAYRIWQGLSSFEAVLFEDLQFVVESSLKKALKNGQKIILEGPGRSLLEANWLSEVFANLELEVAIFHLYISPSETVKRSATRFYVKGVEKPFQSYKIAKESYPNSELYRRPEDEDSDGIMNRYNRLYADIFAQIISVYQLKAKAIVLTVDAHKEVQIVSQTIENYLIKWYL